MIMTLEMIVEALHDRRPSIVAKATGLRVATIIDLKKGHVTNPSYETVKALSAYFQGKAE